MIAIRVCDRWRPHMPLSTSILIGKPCWLPLYTYVQGAVAGMITCPRGSRGSSQMHGHALKLRTVRDHWPAHSCSPSLRVATSCDPEAAVLESCSKHCTIVCDPTNSSKQGTAIMHLGGEAAPLRPCSSQKPSAQCVLLRHTHAKHVNIYLQGLGLPHHRWSNNVERQLMQPYIFLHRTVHSLRMPNQHTQCAANGSPKTEKHAPSVAHTPRCQPGSQFSFGALHTHQLT